VSSPARQRFKALLPNEPRVAGWDLQHALTERFLVPARPGLEALFLTLRATLDPVLSTAQPVKQGKPYPLGQCLEISQAVQRELKQLKPSALAGQAAEGHAAMLAFLKHGGDLRQVWGDLRGEYFQNAYLAGTLYIDVSNDTVVPTKPKVEILPFADARLTPVADYFHFERIATRYWKAQVYPNHLLPSLAPYFPLIVVMPDETVGLYCNSDYMLGLTLCDRFRPSEAMLQTAPSLPPDLFQSMRRCLAGTAFTLASDPGQGRSLALKACREFRSHRRQWHDQHHTLALRHLNAVNRQLARLSDARRAAPAGRDDQHLSHGEIHMSILNIDNRAYDLDSLPAEAKAHLANIQFVDQELARLQAHTAALQTARTVYLAALRDSLPVLGSSDAMKFG